MHLLQQLNCSRPCTHKCRAEVALCTEILVVWCMFGDDVQVVSNLAEYGNTSAASIPLALSEAVESGQIKDGEVLALAGFGAGLTWASAIVRWR